MLPIEFQASEPRDSEEKGFRIFFSLFCGLHPGPLGAILGPEGDNLNKLGKVPIGNAS